MNQTLRFECVFLFSDFFQRGLCLGVGRCISGGTEGHTPWQVMLRGHCGLEVVSCLWKSMPFSDNGLLLSKLVCTWVGLVCLCFLSVLASWSSLDTAPSGHLCCPVDEMVLWHLVGSAFSAHLVSEQRWQMFLRSLTGLHSCAAPVPWPLEKVWAEDGPIINLDQLCCGRCIYREGRQIKRSILANGWLYLCSLFCVPVWSEKYWLLCLPKPWERKSLTDGKQHP